MRRLTFTALSLLLLLGGCSSKSEFFRLQPTLKSSQGAKSLHTDRILGIGEVQVADYLEKPELVTRLNPQRLDVHEERRWAGSLAKGIQQTLQQDLAVLLPRHSVLSYPWEEPVDDRYRLYLTVDRFDGDANGTVVFAGRWSLADRSADRIVDGESFRYLEHGAPSPEGIVATQSRLVGRLARRIASKVRRRF